MIIPNLKTILEYAQLYRNQLFVIKIGGEVLSSTALLNEIALEIGFLNSLSIKVILVHGGGSQITSLCQKLGYESIKINGKRITTPNILEAVIVSLNQLNLKILVALKKVNIKGVGISGIDGNSIVAKKREATINNEGEFVDFGEVGDIEEIDVSLINSLLCNNCIPVVAPLAVSEEGRILNINADTVAGALASKLKAKKLIFLTDTPGLLRKENKSGLLIPFITVPELTILLEEESIQGGMRVKIDTCIQALKNGVLRTHIINGRTIDSLLIEIFTGMGSGTMITELKEADIYTQQEKIKQ